MFFYMLHFMMTYALTIDIPLAQPITVLNGSSTTIIISSSLYIHYNVTVKIRLPVNVPVRLGENCYNLHQSYNARTG